jgi:hypothetical protein
MDFYIVMSLGLVGLGVCFMQITRLLSVLHRRIVALEITVQYLQQVPAPNAPGADHPFPQAGAPHA